MEQRQEGGVVSGHTHEPCRQGQKQKKVLWVLELQWTVGEYLYVYVRVPARPWLFAYLFHCLEWLESLLEMLGYTPNPSSFSLMVVQALIWCYLCIRHVNCWRWLVNMGSVWEMENEQLQKCMQVSMHACMGGPERGFGWAAVSRGGKEDGSGNQHQPEPSLVWSLGVSSAVAWEKR